MMSTVNLPIDVLASDFEDGVEISLEDENETVPEVTEDEIEDAPDVVVNEEDKTDIFADEDVEISEEPELTDETEEDFSAESQEDTELFSSARKIVGFSDFDIEDHYIYVSKTSKPSLDEIVKQMPETLEVYCEDEIDPVALEVS